MEDRNDDIATSPGSLLQDMGQSTNWGLSQRTRGTILATLTIRSLFKGYFSTKECTKIYNQSWVHGWHLEIHSPIHKRTCDGNDDENGEMDTGEEEQLCLGIIHESTC